MSQFENDIREMISELCDGIQSLLDSLPGNETEHKPSQSEKTTCPNSATAAPVSSPAQTMRKNRDARIYVPASAQEKDTLSLSRPITYSEFVSLAQAYIEQKYGAKISSAYGECCDGIFSVSFLDTPQEESDSYAKVMYIATYDLHGTMRIAAYAQKNRTEVSFLTQ